MNSNAPILNHRILRLHAENAAFVAAQHRLGQDGPNFSLIDLYDLENRLAGHLDALSMAGGAGLELVLENLAIAQGFGEVLAPFHVALRQRPDPDLPALLPPEARPWDQVAALGAAAASCAPAVIAERMRHWISGDDPMAVWIALDVCGRHRVDPREHLAPLTGHDDPRVAARAMQLAGEVGRVDLVELLAACAETAADPTLRFWAAWAAALLGDRRVAPAALAAGLGPGTPPQTARRIAELLPLVSDAAMARRWTTDLLDHPATERWGVLATGALGTAGALYWLISRMDQPLVARIAGAAFCRIAGIRLGPLSLELAEFPDDPDDPVVAACPQESFIEGRLYWPDPEKLTRWLGDNRGRFQAETRHLLGAAAWTLQPPIEAAAPWQLDQRALALEIAIRKPGAPLPNWHGAVVQGDRGFTRLW